MQLEMLEDGDLTALYLDSKEDDMYLDNFMKFCTSVTENLSNIAAERVEKFSDRLFSLELPNLNSEENQDLRTSLPEDMLNIITQEISVLHAKTIDARFSAPIINKSCIVCLSSFLSKYCFLVKVKGSGSKENL